MIVSQTGIVEAPSAGFLFVSDHRRMAGVMLVAFDPGTLSAVFRLPTGDESRPFVQVPEAGWADIALSFRRGVLRATVNGRTATRWVGWRLPPRPALLCGSGRFTFALAPGVRPSRRRY